MVKYECFTCNYSTKRKPDFNRHLNTKKHILNNKNCGIMCANIEKMDSKGLKKDSKNEQKGLKRTQKGLKIKKSTSTPELLLKSDKKRHIETKSLICEYCGIELKTQPILMRHIRKYCKVKKSENPENNLINEFKKVMNEHKKEKEKLYDYIEMLIEKKGDTINIENQTNNQIILNNFGSEDISHISDKFMQKLLVIPYVSVQKLIEKVHFSNKKPENKNIALTNKKEKMIKIYKNNKWKYKNRDEIMDEIINTNYTRIDDYYSEKGKENLNDSHNKRYEEFQEKFEKQEDDLHTKIRNESEMILMSDNL